MTLFQLAERFRNEIKEQPGAVQHPFIQWCHSLSGLGFDQPDEVPWCSSFVNAICWMLRLPRSKSAAARSWLGVGTVIDLVEATIGYDIVILRRFINGIDNGVSGHVGIYAGHDSTSVFLLGGNQSNQVTLAPFLRSDIIGVRRLKE